MMMQTTQLLLRRIKGFAFILVVFIQLNGENTQAQSPAIPLIRPLVEHGFVNVSATAAGATLVLEYENRRYRSEARGMAEVLRLALPHLAAYDSLNLVALHYGKPILLMETPTDELLEYSQNGISVEQWLSLTTWSMATANQTGSRARTKRHQVPTLRSFDVSVGLGTRYVLGNFGTLDDNYRVSLDLEPEVRMDLPLGFLAVARLSVPVHNNLDDNTRVRTSLLTLNKPLYFKGPTIASIQAGVFTMNRIGVHSNVRRYFSGGTFSVGMQGGYTQFTDLNGRVQVPSVEEQSYAVFLVSGAWRYKPYGVEIEATYGQFLYQDNGVRIDVRRSVGDHRLGFFAMDTELGRNMGFQIALALPPRRYSKPIPARVRPAEHFSFDYRFGAGDRTGRMYDTADYYVEQLYMYDPEHVKHELLRYF